MGTTEEVPIIPLSCTLGRRAADETASHVNKQSFFLFYFFFTALTDGGRQAAAELGCTAGGSGSLASSDMGCNANVFHL